MRAWLYEYLTSHPTESRGASRPREAPVPRVSLIERDSVRVYEVGPHWQLVEAVSLCSPTSSQLTNCCNAEFAVIFVCVVYTVVCTMPGKYDMVVYCTRYCPQCVHLSWHWTINYGKLHNILYLNA